MKILIAYDGSECSDAAIIDLRRAGLPAVADVLVLSVAEIPMAVASVPCGALVAGPGLYPSEIVDCEETSSHVRHEAEAYAAQAADRLHGDFPGWKINTEAWVDSAGSAIVRVAHAWKPDLVIVGSHGRLGFSRFVLGSVSQHVLHNVDCSVRISRHHLHSQARPIHVMVGVDGSDDSKQAVKAVAARTWPAGTEARVVSILDSRLTLQTAAAVLDGAIPAAIEQDDSRRLISAAARQAAEELLNAGLIASHAVTTGKPAEALLAEADKCGADCIFVGARGLNRLERIVLGSVSGVVAARAACSVEIVRPPVA
jgi:nucleotide-binding universal stress UspA family protein